MTTGESEALGPEEYVARWLRESGLGLEMRVADCFRRLVGGEQVEHARHYGATDGGDHKLREVDVVVKVPHVAGGWDFQLTLVVECKTTSTPWVLVRDRLPDSRHVGSFRQTLPNRMIYVRGVDSMQSLEVDSDPLLGPTEARAFHIVDAAASKASGKAEARNLAWDAVRQCLDAANGLYEEIYPHAGEIQTAGQPYLRLWLPVVVTTAPLFAAYTDERGEHIVEPIKRAPMVGRLRLGRRDDFGFRTAVPAGLWVVSFDGLEEFAAMAVNSGRMMRLREPS